MQGEGRLDHRGQSRSRPGVPDVSLGRGRRTGGREPVGESFRRRVGVADVRPSPCHRPERPSGRSRDGLAIPGGPADAPDQGVDPVAIANGIVEPLDDQHRRAIGEDRRRPEPAGGERRPEFAREVHRADDHPVQFAATEHPAGDLKGREPGGLLARNREAGPAQAELASDPTGHDAAERPHRPVRRERRAESVAKLADPVRESFVLKPEAEPIVPFAGLIEQRPADMKIRRVQVEPEPDQASPSQPGRLVIPTGVGDGLVGQPEQQRLLGEHLLQLFGRDAEPIGRQGHPVDPVGEVDAIGESSGLL